MSLILGHLSQAMREASTTHDGHPVPGFRTAADRGTAQKACPSFQAPCDHGAGAVAWSNNGRRPHHSQSVACPLSDGSQPVGEACSSRRTLLAAPLSHAVVREERDGVGPVGIRQSRLSPHSPTGSEFDPCLSAQRAMGIC